MVYGVAPLDLRGYISKYFQHITYMSGHGSAYEIVNFSNVNFALHLSKLFSFKNKYFRLFLGSSSIQIIRLHAPNPRFE